MEIVLHGAFVIVEFDGKFLFTERVDGGLDIPGGGYGLTEIKYREVVQRELEEETGIVIPENSFLLCAILGQRLRKEVIERYGVEHGYVYLHKITLYEKPSITLSPEHTSYEFYSCSEVIKNYKEFKSGPLWLFFTYLAFQESHKLQEGMLYDRRIWKGKEYV